jgi:hypothetical protein
LEISFQPLRICRLTSTPGHNYISTLDAERGEQVKIEKLTWG